MLKTDLHHFDSSELDWRFESAILQLSNNEFIDQTYKHIVWPYEENAPELWANASISYKGQIHRCMY